MRGCSHHQLISARRTHPRGRSLRRLSELLHREFRVIQWLTTTAGISELRGASWVSKCTIRTVDRTPLYAIHCAQLPAREGRRWKNRCPRRHIRRFCRLQSSIHTSQDGKKEGHVRQSLEKRARVESRKKKTAAGWCRTELVEAPSSCWVSRSHQRPVGSHIRCSNAQHCSTERQKCW